MTNPRSLICPTVLDPELASTPNLHNRPVAANASGQHSRRSRVAPLSLHMIQYIHKCRLKMAVLLFPTLWRKSVQVSPTKGPSFSNWIGCTSADTPRLAKRDSMKLTPNHMTDSFSGLTSHTNSMEAVCWPLAKVMTWIPCDRFDSMSVVPLDKRT